jgi:hypothetical protein
MGIVRYTLEKVTGSENKDGPSYTAEYLVTVSSPDDHVKTILDNMPWGFGQEFRIGNDHDPDAIVLSASAEPVRGNNFAWMYSVVFGVPESSEQVENPVEEPAQIEMIFSQNEKLIERDIHGKPIQNTVGDRFDDVMTREDSQPILRVTRNEPAAMALFGVDLRDTVNRSPWQGAARRTVKFQAPTLRSKYHRTLGTYYEKSYEFKFSDDTWRFILLNQGYYEKGDGEDDDGRAKRIRIRVNDDGEFDPNGDPVTTPIALTKEGRILPVDKEPIWLEFDGYREAMFPDFGFFL